MTRSLQCAIVLTITLGCSDDNATRSEDSKLDCDDLRVTDVVRTNDSQVFPGESVFRVRVENTCEICQWEGFFVYENFYMIDKTTNDTLASYEFWNLQPPVDDVPAHYDLRARVSNVPDLNNVKFVMYSTCLDIKYAPK